MGREEHEWLPENLKLITQNKREQQRGRRRGEGGGGREGKAASVMTVDKQQQCGMAQDTCHEMKGNREKNEEQGEKISHFFVESPTENEGRYVDASSCIVGSRCVILRVIFK